MVVITWQGCIVPFPASLQFSSSLEHKYLNTGQNTCLKWNVTNNYSLTLFGVSFKHFYSLLFQNDVSQHNTAVKTLIHQTK